MNYLVEEIISNTRAPKIIYHPKRYKYLDNVKIYERKYYGKNVQK